MNFEVLSKIKCIWDCYITAYDIFAEIIAHVVQERSMIQFGLNQIDGILHITVDLN
jgi:hypothetical protein